MLRTALLLLSLLLLPAAIYSATFTNGYVWDDWTLFINSPALRADDLSWAALSQPILDGTTYFRPVVLLTFAAEFKFFGVSAFVSHLVNLLIQQANVLLLFALALKLTRRLNLSRPEIRAALASLLYLVHPSLVESVAWASGRFDLLTTFFTLSALVADAYISVAALRLLIIGFCFAGALGSKELGITLPVLLLLQRLLTDRLDGEAVWRRCTVILRQEMAVVLLCTAIFVAYVVLRLNAMGHLLHVDPTLSKLTSNPFDRALLILNTFAFYFRETLVPFGSVGPFHPLDLDSVTSGAGLLVSLVSAGVLITIVVGAMRGAPPAILLVGALTALLPVSQVVPITIGGNIGHDRFLALPLAFVALAVAMAKLIEIPQLRPRAQMVIVGIVAAFWLPGAAFTARIVTAQWKSDLSLWSWTYYRYPDFRMAQLNFASSAMMAGRPELAKVVFDNLMKDGRPLEALHQLNYGAYLVLTGDIAEGSKYIEGALLAFPPLHRMSSEERAKWRSAQFLGYSMAAAYSALATAHANKGEFSAALEDVNSSLWYKPRWPALLIQKSNVLLGLNRTAESGDLLREALSISVPERVPLETRRRAAFIHRLCRDFPQNNPEICDKK